MLQGNAGWSRAQLLGEIAHGSWGLCRASSGDLTSNIADRWSQLTASNRLAFAPINEMTEDYVTEMRSAGSVRTPSEQEAIDEQRHQREQIEMEQTRRMAVALENIEGPELTDDEEEG